ncbi:hypothetical protein BS47DRAFT_1397313 [Hydnum rufescens UP504]|uniref:Sof1-like protein domain-containing protein n=1 Tax=Hydnum rufescens UP504 TaxID=1448309 RepID=A0A9P6ANY0_9AGAM|nr:hypothetical protein BS47DRAFT_1397313 [Hydnum rufescens UP504]
MVLGVDCCKRALHDCLSRRPAGQCSALTMPWAVPGPLEEMGYRGNVNAMGSDMRGWLGLREMRSDGHVSYSKPDLGRLRRGSLGEAWESPPARDWGPDTSTVREDSFMGDIALLESELPRCWGAPLHMGFELGRDLHRRRQVRGVEHSSSHLPTSTADRILRRNLALFLNNLFQLHPFKLPMKSLSKERLSHCYRFCRIRPEACPDLCSVSRLTTALTLLLRMSARYQESSGKEMALTFIAFPIETRIILPRSLFSLHLPQIAEACCRPGIRFLSDIPPVFQRISVVHDTTLRQMTSLTVSLAAAARPDTLLQRVPRLPNLSIHAFDNSANEEALEANGGLGRLSPLAQINLKYIAISPAHLTTSPFTFQNLPNVSDLAICAPDRRDSSVADHLPIIFSKFGRDEEALKANEEALEIRSDVGNLHLLKGHASEKLGIIDGRERAATAYRAKLGEKWKYDPEVGKIERYVNVQPRCNVDICQNPFNTAKLTQTMLDAERVKEDRRRKHSRTGETEPKAERRKVVAEQT